MGDALWDQRVHDKVQTWYGMDAAGRRNRSGKKAHKGESVKITDEHVIKNVTYAKYTEAIFYIPESEHKLLKEILQDKGNIQLRFKINDEEFFTKMFKTKPNKNYEKLFYETIKKFPQKIIFTHTDLKIQVV